MTTWWECNDDKFVAIKEVRGWRRNRSSSINRVDVDRKRFSQRKYIVIWNIWNGKNKRYRNGRTWVNLVDYMMTRVQHSMSLHVVIYYSKFTFRKKVKRSQKYKKILSNLFSPLFLNQYFYSSKCYSTSHKIYKPSTCDLNLWAFLRFCCFFHDRKLRCKQKIKLLEILLKMFVFFKTSILLFMVENGKVE